jgi:hypothetical protein
MPVTMPDDQLRRRPPINKIGAVDTEDTRSYFQMTPEQPPADGQRKKEALVPVWAPDGHMEMHTTFNARDLINHSKWTAFDPAKVKKKKADPSDPDGGTLIEAEAADLVEAPKAPSKLDELRDFLATIAPEMEIDKRWGLTRLKKEIEARGAEVPA